ncbi:hypothetical protein SAY87_005386 [Trapa incisa]|uniref:Bifunctional inhibitor/plant lipid transfer protein/seed storage helical domain-containing protein n=1 Tax=Trapa incisa TaxID=236973 RepID=A0AAN7K9R6_9MYRT|nr:hypothetical protein SAY87_005386 [Trapa incisa]
MEAAAAAGRRRRSSSVSAMCLPLTVVAVMLCSAEVVHGDSTETLRKMCSGEIGKTTNCLNYAMGKEAKPTTNCCDSVKEIRAKDPVCLCFLIQLVHNGADPQINNMHLNETLLLQLPSACSIQNATISDCPRLLGIPETSPAAAIFTNANTTVPTSAPETVNSPSIAARRVSELPTSVLLMAAAVFLGAFSIHPSGETFGLW